MITVGITGGIGSGKSIVAKLLNVWDIPVYDADVESKKLVAASPTIKKALTGRFGNDLYRGNVPDKARLASLIFTNTENLLFVNSIVHPVVMTDFIRWTKTVNAPVIALESAILFESGWGEKVDYTVCITAPLELRIERVMLRNKITAAEVRQRINSQWTDEEKCNHSRFVVLNDGCRAIIPQLEEIICEIVPESFGRFKTEY
jgi:dephospho-CoA kinase